MNLPSSDVAGGRSAILAMIVFTLVGGVILCGSRAAASDGAGNVRMPGRITELQIPSQRAGPSIVVRAPDGAMWVALAKVGKLARFREVEAKEFNLPDGAFPVGVVVDPDGSVWYSDINRNAIGHLDPSTGSVDEFRVPTKNSWPFFLVRDGSGIIWFTERLGNKIGRLDPLSRRITEVELPRPGCEPAGMTIGSDGCLYFTENAGHRIGCVDPKSGEISELEIPTKMQQSPHYGPAGITTDTRGDVWFCVLDGQIGRIVLPGRRVTCIQVPDASARPAGIVVDQWDVVWFTQLDGNSIGAFYPEFGVFREFPVPTGRPDPRPMGPPEATARGQLPTPGPTARTSRPFGLAVDGAGRVWFSEQYGGRIGVVTPPAVDIVTPRGEVRTGTVPLRVKVRTDGLHAQNLTIRLNGAAAPMADSVSFEGLLPGDHAIHVTARDGEILASAETRFVPGLDVLHRIAGASTDPLLVETAVRLDAAVDAGTRGDTRALREGVRAAIGVLRRGLNRDGLTTEARHLLAHLRYYDLFADRRYQVRWTSTGFRPRSIALECGDQLELLNETDEAVTIVSSSERQAAAVVGAHNHRVLSFMTRGDVAVRAGPDRSGALAISVDVRTTLMLEIPMAGPDRVPTVVDSDRFGNIWFTAGGGGYSRLAHIPLNNIVGRLSPNGEIREFVTPTPESAPTSIEVGRDGRVWFTQRGADSIGMIDPNTEKVEEFKLPTEAAGATGLETDPRSGNIWFTEKKAAKFGVLDPTTGQVREFATPNLESLPSTIALDSEGNVWLDERATDTILRYRPGTGEFSSFKVPTPGSRVVGVTPHTDGRIWFCELGGNKIGRLDPGTGVIAEYCIPTPSSAPFKLALDAAGRVWFTQAFGNNIGVLDTDGRIWEFAAPTPAAMLGGIHVDSFGNVWFTEQAGNAIGLIPAGALFSGGQASTEATDAMVAGSLASTGARSKP